MIASHRSPTPSPRILDAVETAASLDFDRLVPAIERAAVDAAGGRIVCPERQVVRLTGDATMLSMPAVAADVAIHKLITVAPGNRARGEPTIQGSMTIFDPASGRPLLVLDGPTVTARRTAAVSRIALQRLARPGARRVLLIGTGVQAAAHVAMLARGWQIRVRGRSRESADAFCRAHRDRADDIAPASDADADVVITCTTSAVPVWSCPARAHTLVVAVGSFRPHIAEIDATVVQASTLFVDDPQGAPHEAGDYVQAGVDWAGVTSLAALVGDGGRRPDGPVLFKSVGSAAWDLAAARVALGTLAVDRQP